MPSFPFTFKLSSLLYKILYILLFNEAYPFIKCAFIKCISVTINLLIDEQVLGKFFFCLGKKEGNILICFSFLLKQC